MSKEHLSEDPFSTNYRVTLFSIFKFELKSFLGRLILSRRPPRVESEIKLLNLGCGGTLFVDWVNADFFMGRFWKAPKSFWMLDLRYNLYCDDNYWDGIFTEHTIEHLYPEQVRKLLKELWRTLMPGGWIRISVPDLKKYVDYYNGSNTDAKFLRWKFKASAIRQLTQGSGHLSVWDEDLLGAVLKDVGFVNIKRVSFRQGSDRRLLKDGYEREWESLYVEAQKP